MSTPEAALGPRASKKGRHGFQKGPPGLPARIKLKSRQPENFISSSGITRYMVLVPERWLFLYQPSEIKIYLYRTASFTASLQTLQRQPQSPRTAVLEAIRPHSMTCAYNEYSHAMISAQVLYLALCHYGSMHGVMPYRACI